MAEETEKENLETETEKVEVVETDEEAEAKAMSASFNDEPPPEETVKSEEESDETESKEEEPKQSDPPEPEYVQLTKADHDAFKATMTKIASLEKGLSSVGGTMGGLQQTLQRLQSETPAGEPVVVTDEDVAEFAADFPELAARFKTTLQRIADRLNAKGTAKVVPAFDEEAAAKFYATREEARELALLDGLVPDWAQIVGKHDDAENGYRKWLASKDEAYRTLVENTTSAMITARSIELYQQETAPKPEQKPAPKSKPSTKETPEAAARRERIASAVTPKGAAQTPRQKEESEEEAMSRAFNSTNPTASPS